MKKVLSLVLVLAMVLGSFSFVSAASYTDVTGTEFTAAVDRLSTLGILEGYPDGTFKPTESITRAEFAAVAVRAKGLKDVALAAQGLPTGFTDVPTTHWASGYVGTAARLGIVNGIGWGQFAPASPVKYEEAVTMIVRALGYEAAAQAKGGYPYGYLIVASEIDLLDGVKGTQGVSATRGLVAQLTDNALEIAMMVQVGFGSEAKWVVSGSKEHGDDAIYLLDAMGFDSVEGRVVAVNTTTNKITVDPTDEDLKNVTLKVAKGFDFYAVEGLETKFWSKDDMVEVYVVNEEAKFDAVKVDGDELVLIVEDENYDVARGAVLTIDGEKVAQKDFVADYAKIVLNDDNEIIWAQGYNLDGFILVEEVKDEVAYSYDGYDEIDLEDFTVIKEGKTIGIDAIEEEDVLFFNVDEEFAVVYNKGTEGELDRVYVDGAFRFEGKGYSLSAIATPIYFDEGKVGELDATILDDFLDEEATITVFVDFAGKVVVVAGEVNSVGNSAYAVVTADVVEYAGRKGTMLALDVRNGANEKVSYDILVADLGDDIDLINLTVSQLKGIKKADDIVLKISVDKDGDVTALELPEVAVGVAKSFEIDDANVKVGLYSYKLQSSTIVFYDSNKKATTIGAVKDEFTEVKAEATIYVEKGRVVAVVGETDTDADTKDVTGLVTGVKALTNGQLQFTVKVFGVTQRLVTEAKNLNEATHKAMYLDKIATFEVGETSGEIKAFGTVGQRTLTISSISGRTITPTTGTAVELNTSAVIYDAKFETMNLRELVKGDVVTVYFQGSSNRFVDYVIVGGAVIIPPAETTGLVTYIDGTQFNVTLPSDAKATDTFIVKVGTDNATVVNGKANLTPATAWVNGTLKTAELYNIADLNKVLASHNFVVKAAVVPAISFTAVSSAPGNIVATVTGTLSGARLVTTDSLGNEIDNRSAATFTQTGLVEGATYTLKLMSGTEVLSTKTVKVMTTAENTAAADAQAVATAKDTVLLGFAGTDTATNVTTSPITLNSTPGTTTITWTSSNPAVVSNAGVVVRPVAGAADATVTLTAKIVKGDAEDTKVFTVVVKAMPTQAQLDADAAAAFRTTHATALGKTLATVAAADNQAAGVVDAALTAFGTQTAGAKALLATEKAKLDDLAERSDAIQTVITTKGTADAAFKAALEDPNLGLDLSAYNGLALESFRTQARADFVAANGATAFTTTASVQAALDAIVPR